MRPVAIIQARMGSSRLPKKVLAPLAGHNVLYYVIKRCQLSKKLEEVIVATTTKTEDDKLVDFVGSLGVKVFRGSENDVLERYIEAAVKVDADPVIRVTGDCPLIEPAIIDDIINLYMKTAIDYAFIDGYPRGVDGAEALSLSALQRTLKETSPEDIYYREHVMTYITDNPDKFKIKITKAPKTLNKPELRLCVDEAADLEVVRRICEHFKPREDFKLSEILAFLNNYPKIAYINRHVRQKTR